VRLGGSLPFDQREMAVEIEALFALPAHPLVVHAAVVLPPLATMSPSCVQRPLAPGGSMHLPRSGRR
jgi:hypothetical protein